MKILITVLFVCILLTGCEKKEKIYTVGLFGSNVVGDSYGVKIDNIWKASDGLKVADKHCGKYGKRAYIVGHSGYVGVYDCVKQSISGNKNYVTLTLYGEENEALPYAEKHCNKFGRSATYKSKEKYKVIFDCIE